MAWKRNNSDPPKVMTWTEASPAIIIAVLFDAIRIFFTFFWFLGPAMAAVACTSAVNNLFEITVATFAGKTVATACTAGASIVGFFGFEFTATFGSVMAMVTGFAGWLIIGIWLLATNSRIFKENALWFIGSLVVSEIPFIDSLPAITIAVWEMYHAQIKKEKLALKQWKDGQVATQLQGRERQVAELMQYQAAQFEQAEIY